MFAEARRWTASIPMPVLSRRETGTILKYSNPSNALTARSNKTCNLGKNYNETRNTNLTGSIGTLVGIWQYTVVGHCDSYCCAEM